MSVAVVSWSPRTLETRSSLGPSDGVPGLVPYSLGIGTITGTQTIGKVHSDSTRQSATKDGCVLHAVQDNNDDYKTRCFDVAFDLLFVALCMKRGKFAPLFLSRRVVHWLMSFNAN
jgi:hypothetical protein